MAHTAKDILSQTALYGRLGERALGALAGIARVSTVPAGRVLLCVGEPCPAAFAVGSGIVELRQGNASGKVHLLRTVRANETLGEAAVLGSFPCPVTGHVTEEAVLCRLPADPLRQLVAEDHEICLLLLRELARRQRRIVRHTEDLVLRDATGRFAAYLRTALAARGKGDDALHLDLPKRSLAEHLNVTSETLSRVFRYLANQGVIRIERETVHVIDHGALSVHAGGDDAGADLQRHP